jgi:hypothetical protein
VNQATLVDAGPLVAILHRDDAEHARCADALKRLRPPLVTTWAPITEALYLLSFSLDAQEALLEMIERGALAVLPLEPSDATAIRKLLRKYRDLPMDFADATLVRVAEREGIKRIFTLDRRDFAVYRVGRRALVCVP